jgi:serine/threonine protein kinase
MEEIKFRIEFNELIGKGGFGEVYIAYNINDKKQIKTKYAAKKLPPKLQEKEYLELYSNEILISTQFNNPNLVKFYGLTEENESIFMIYEYCNGTDLNKYLKDYYQKFQKGIGEPVVQKILKDILNGLSCLHRNKVVHHDIKPANILLQYNTEEDKNNLNYKNCTFKLSDFGLSKFKDDGQSTHAFGTATFMDPISSIYQKMEKFNEDKTDIWSIGILTYRLLFTNTHPFIPNEMWKLKDQNRYLQSMKENIINGEYIVNINQYEVSKEALCFLDSCLKLDQNLRKSSEDLEYSWFVSRNVSKFHFVNKDNFEQEIPNEYQGKMEVKFNIHKNNKIEDCFNL